MNNTRITTQTSLDLLLTSITDIVRYSVHKKRYECELIVREQMRKVREAKFVTATNEFNVITRQLNQLKVKWEILECEIENYPEELRNAWDPLRKELQNKINFTRMERLKKRI